MKPAEMLETIERIERRLARLEAHILNLQSLLVVVCAEPKPVGGLSRAELQRTLAEGLAAQQSALGAKPPNAPSPGGNN